MFGTRRISGQIGKIDFGRCGGGEFNFGFFSGFSDSLDGHFVFGDVNSTLDFEFILNVLLDHGIKIFSSTRSISVSGFNFKHSIGDFENRDIEGSSSEIIDCDQFSIVFVKSISKSSGGGFVDNSLNVKSGYFSGIFGGLSLGIVEIGGDSHDSFGDGFTEIRFSSFFHLIKDHGSHLGGGILSSVDFNPGISVVVSNDFVREMFKIFLDGSIGELSTD